jgi:hypothetical protein
MLRIDNLRKKTIEKINKYFGTSDWILEEVKTFGELVMVDIHPAVEVHLYYDHLTLEYHDRYYDIEKDEFSTLIYS